MPEAQERRVSCLEVLPIWFQSRCRLHRSNSPMFHSFPGFCREVSSFFASARGRQSVWADRSLMMFGVGPK